MKRLSILLLLATMAFVPKSEETIYKVDPGKSTIRWTGYSVFSFNEHYGTMALKKGTLKKANGVITGGEFELDMNSIHDEDMPSNDGGADLENHLKSEDFFDSDKFPTATFKILECKKPNGIAATDPRWDVSGSLTIKGITNPVTLPATISEKGNQIVIHAKFKFDRTKWNVRYNSGRFFDDVGDGAISDAIGMEIDVTATSTTQP